MVKKCMFLSLVLILILSFPACGGDEHVAEEAASPEPVTFEPITVAGSGSKTSAPFDVTTEEWILEWAYVPESEYLGLAIFTFFVYPRGETAVYVESMVYSEGTSGVTYCYAGPGEYYVKVTALNIKSWEIVISPAE